MRTYIVCTVIPWTVAKLYYLLQVAMHSPHTPLVTLSTLDSHIPPHFTSPQPSPGAERVRVPPSRSMEGKMVHSRGSCFWLNVTPFSAKTSHSRSYNRPLSDRRHWDTWHTDVHTHTHTHYTGHTVCTVHTPLNQLSPYKGVYVPVHICTYKCMHTMGIINIRLRILYNSESGWDSSCPV